MNEAISYALELIREYQVYNKATVESEVAALYRELDSECSYALAGLNAHQVSALLSYRYSLPDLKAFIASPVYKCIAAKDTSEIQSAFVMGNYQTELFDQRCCEARQWHGIDHEFVHSSQQTALQRHQPIASGEPRQLYIVQSWLCYPEVEIGDQTLHHIIANSHQAAFDLLKELDEPDDTDGNVYIRSYVDKATVLRLDSTEPDVCRILHV